MSLVKWADSHELTDGPERFNTVPVIPLADLTEVVEGLTHLTLSNHGYKPDGCSACEAVRMTVTQLEAHRKEGA